MPVGSVFVIKIFMKFESWELASVKEQSILKIYGKIYLKSHIGKTYKSKDFIKYFTIYDCMEFYWT